MYFGDLILGGGGVEGRMMIGEGVMSAVCGLRWCMTVLGAVVCSVWTDGGDVSFSGVGCQRTVVDIVVVVGLVAAVGWRGNSPAEGAGCLPLSVHYNTFCFFKVFSHYYKDKIFLKNKHFIIQERCNKLIYGINTIINLASDSLKKYQWVSRSWTGSEIIWLRNKLFRTVLKCPR